MNSNPTGSWLRRRREHGPGEYEPAHDLGYRCGGAGLTAGVGSWSGSPTSYAFQWRRCDTGGNACATVAGATASSYLLGSGDRGYTIRVNVFATNAAGTGSMNSNPTGTVVAAATSTAPVNTSLPTISGTAVVGQSLTAGVGSWSGSPTSYLYQWRRCDSAVTTCATVAGADGEQLSARERRPWLHDPGQRLRDQRGRHGLDELEPDGRRRRCTVIGTRDHEPACDLRDGQGWVRA